MYLIQRQTDDGWADQYSFEETEISKEDIEIANYYMANNENSHFTKFNFIGLFTEDGRKGLFNTNFNNRKGIEVFEKRSISYGENWLDTLKKEFNIELDYTYNDENDPNRFYYRSDHYNFAKNNIPIIFYFNGTHDDYHRPGDTPDKINYDLLENRSRLIFHTAWEVANRNARVVVDKESE